MHSHSFPLALSALLSSSQPSVHAPSCLRSAQGRLQAEIGGEEIYETRFDLEGTAHYYNLVGAAVRLAVKSQETALLVGRVVRNPMTIVAGIFPHPK